MTTSAERIRTYDGPAVLGYGFRPLFLLAGLWACVAMVLWVAVLAGAVTLPGLFTVIDWHAHELLFGYLSAVVAGFLLTAVPNWTGRLPVTGTPLLLLSLCWIAGRLAVLFSEFLGWVFTAVLDLAFLAALIAVIGREIIAGENRRNLKILVMVALLLCANAVFHLEAAWYGSAMGGYGVRLGTAVAVLLIVVIGGRIVPSFTRNWLAKRGPGRMPVAFNRFDMIATGFAAAGLLLWVAAPYRVETAALCLVAGVVHLWRLGRWAGERTWAEPLVTILHVGYLFVPLGFLLLGLSVLQPGVLTQSAALHAWLTGAIGVMTLAVMTRASLGHGGKALHAGPGITTVYACVFLSALARIAAGMGFAPEPLLHLAGTAWIAGFAGFVLLFAPILLRRSTPQGS